MLAAPADGTRGNGHKLVNVSIWRQENSSFFPVRVVKHRHKLPRDIVESPFGEIPQTQLDIVLGNLLSLTLRGLD